MAPFPETEIMTIKRLEVALRRMDFKLLKEGSYKLHEKYHSGHRFEYLDLLKDIFLEVTNNSSIPEDVKGILLPTLEDILTAAGKNMNNALAPVESFDNQNRVSSLTSLSYSTRNNQDSQPQQEEEPACEEKISAFNVFRNEHKAEQDGSGEAKISSDSAPFREFIVPQSVNVPAAETKIEEIEVTGDIEEVEEIPTQIMFEPEIKEEPAEKIPQKIKTVSIFYMQDNSPEKSKNIFKLRGLIQKSLNDNISLNETARLISEINTQSDTNVSELKSILEQLKVKGNKINLITNSSSSNFFELFRQSDLSYELFKDGGDINLMPLFGLSNFFVCSQCREKHLELNNVLRPLALECPRCKSPMFADLYALNSYRSAEINLEYYNSSMIALSKSSTWLLIHPLLDETITRNLLISALKMSHDVQEVYILDKDINTRETYRNIFLDINENLQINTKPNALEEFFSPV